jgi:Flp pilus assembly protein TadG
MTPRLCALLQRSRGIARRQEGSASVEFAVSSVVFFTTLIGLMKMCLALYTFHFVAEAAREGSRYAIVRGTACSGFTTACPANTNGSDTSNFVKGLSYPGISPAAMTVSSSYNNFPAGKVCTPSSACNNPGDQVTVQVQYAFPLSIPFLPSNTYIITSSSSMIIQR